MRTWIFTLCMGMLSSMLWAQDAFTLQGIVTDQNLDPLFGAHIQLNEGEYVTSTDLDGKFSFSNVNKGNYQLKVSYIGYETQAWEVKIEGDQSMNLQLKEANILTDEILVSALRADESTGTTYENVDREEVERSAVGRELPYLFQMMPSVVVTSDAGQGIGHTSMRIRGSDATRINATINGIPYNDAESQGTFWVNMPDFMSSVESVQVQRGVGTSTNGGGAFGASLNVNTNALNIDPYVHLNNSAGSFGSFKNTVRLGSGLIKDQFVLDARLSRVKSDGFIDRGFSDMKSLYLSGGWYGNDKILRFNIISGSQKTYQSWNGIPEDILATNRTYNAFTYEDQTDNYRQTHFQLHWSQQLRHDWNWSISLNYTPGAGYYEEYKEEEDFEEYGLTPIRVGDQEIRTTDLVRQLHLDNHFYGFTTHTNWDATDRLGFTLGGAFFRYTGDHFGELRWARYASDSFIGDHFYFNDAIKDDGNVYLKTVWRTPKNSVYLDLQTRFIYYDLKGMDRGGAMLDMEDHMFFFNPKVGYTHYLSDRSQFYASLAKASREPNRSDYKESTEESRPKPEELYNLEAGYRMGGSRNRFSGNLYYMYYHNQLVMTGMLNDVGKKTRSNVKNSYRIGVELADEYLISEKWSLNANLAVSANKIPEYTEYMDVYDADFVFQRQEKIVYENTDIALSPAVVGGVGFSFSPLKALSLEWESKYVSRQYLDNTSSKNRSIDPFSFSNVRLMYEKPLFSTENVTLALDLNNIFGAKYEADGYTFGQIVDGIREDYNYYYPQAGFNFMVSLNVRL